jgi:predicted Zn-dependent protease
LYDSLVRFGRWDEMLGEPTPDRNLAGLSISFHQARAIALAAKGRTTEAEQELRSSEALIAAAPGDAAQGMNPARSVYDIGQHKAAARLVAAKGNRNEGIALLVQATALEDKLSYNEPEDVFFPVRHMLGAMLLDAGRAGEAESVFREDLRRHPKNGWALTGLKAALVAQKRLGELGQIDAELHDAWAHADQKIERASY